MKIVADENIPQLQTLFSRFGDITALPGRNLTPAQVKDADILLVRSVTKVHEALLLGSSVKFVGTCTIGTDHIDRDYLKQNNIALASAPGCNAGGVLQYVLSALASLDEGSFDKRFGVIGSGNVGGKLCSALRAMGVKVVAYDPFLTPRDNPSLTDLGDVLSCDIICMHVPYTTGGRHPSHHMINSSNLALLKPGAILINAGRGGTIDNVALKAHLQNGADLKVILDVWENEPEIDLGLMDLVAFATPHIAGYSFEGRLNGSRMIFEALCHHLNIADGERLADAALKSVYGEPVVLRGHDVVETVLATYRVRDDDLRTRSAFTSEQGVGKEFDLLRKHYPQRREFGHYKVETPNIELKRTLSHLGFVV